MVVQLDGGIDSAVLAACTVLYLFMLHAAERGRAAVAVWRIDCAPGIKKGTFSDAWLPANCLLIDANIRTHRGQGLLVSIRGASAMQ